VTRVINAVKSAVGGGGTTNAGAAVGATTSAVLRERFFFSAAEGGGDTASSTGVIGASMGRDTGGLTKGAGAIVDKSMSDIGMNCGLEFAISNKNFAVFSNKSLLIFCKSVNLISIIVVDSFL
jgi:hypothetical protein